MKRLKIYVGLRGRFVLCEEFPDDEKHCGLNEMLKEMIDEDPYISGTVATGFYWATIEMEGADNQDPQYDSHYLYVDKIEGLETQDTEAKGEVMKAEIMAARALIDAIKADSMIGVDVFASCYEAARAATEAKAE